MKFRDLTDMTGTDLFHWTMRRHPTVYRNTAKITIQENIYAPIQRANRINFECCALDMIGINAHNHAITELTLTVAANEFVARLYSLINYTNFTFANSILFVEDEEAFYVSDEDASLYTMNIQTLESMLNTYENELDTKPSLSPSMESLYEIIKNQSLYFFKPLLEGGLLNPDTGIRKGERLYKLDVDKFIKRSDDNGSHRKEYMAFLDSYSYLIDAYCYAIEKDGKKFDFDENKASNPLLYCVIDEDFSDNVKTDFRKKADVIIRDLDTYYGKLFDSTLKHLSKIQSFAEDYAIMREDDDEDEKNLSDRIQSAKPNVDYAYTTCSHHFETVFDDDEEKEEDSTELELKTVQIPPEEMEDLSEETSEEPPEEKPEEKEEKPKKRTTRKKKSEDSSSEEKPKKKRGRPKKVLPSPPVEEEVPELTDVSEGPSIKVTIGCPVDEDGNPLPEDTEIVSEPIDFDELHRQDVTDTVDQATAIPVEETDTSDQDTSDQSE